MLPRSSRFLSEPLDQPHRPDEAYLMDGKYEAIIRSLFYPTFIAQTMSARPPVFHNPGCHSIFPSEAYIAHILPSELYIIDVPTRISNGYHIVHEQFTKAGLSCPLLSADGRLYPGGIDTFLDGSSHKQCLSGQPQSYLLSHPYSGLSHPSRHACPCTLMHICFWSDGTT